MIIALASLYIPFGNSACWRHIRDVGHIAQRAGASASGTLSGVFDVRAIGVIMVDVAGGAVVPNGTLGTTSVLLVSNPGCANLRVAWITSIMGNSRRSAKIRATSRCTGLGISSGLSIVKSLAHRPERSAILRGISV